MSEGVLRDTQEGAGSTTATLRCGSPGCPASSSGASGRRWGSFLPMALLNPLHPPHRSYQEGSASCAISPAGCCLSSGSQDTNVLFMITSQPRSQGPALLPGGQLCSWGASSAPEGASSARGATQNCWV